MEIPAHIEYNVKLNGEVDAVLRNNMTIAVSIEHGIITLKALGELSRKVRADIYWLIGKGFDSKIVNKALKSRTIILTGIATLNDIAERIGYRKWKETNS